MRYSIKQANGDKYVTKEAMNMKTWEPGSAHFASDEKAATWLTRGKAQYAKKGLEAKFGINLSVVSLDEE